MDLVFWFWGFFFLSYMVLRIEPRTLCMLGKCSAPSCVIGPWYWYVEKPSNSMADSAEEIRVYFPKEGDVIWNMWSKQAVLSWEGWMWGRWSFQMGNGMYVQMQNVCPSSYFLSKTHLFQNMAGGYVYGLRLSTGFTEILSCVRSHRGAICQGSHWWYVSW